MAIPAPQDCGIGCDLCGNNEFLMLHQWPVGSDWNPATIPISVWQCQGCQLVVLHPIPTPEQLPDTGDWWSKDRKRQQRNLWFKAPWEHLRYKMIGHARDRFVHATRIAAPSGRLLDVGSGTGQLLLMAQKFYQCVGVEPSAKAVDQSRTLGLEVIHSTFEEVQLENESFDVVLLDAVIEHVLSPKNVLEKVNAILRPGGVVGLKTPKFDGPSYRRHKAAWNGFRHGYHTFLFTGKTLGAYLEQSGFEVVKKPRRDRPWDDILILWGRKVELARAA